MANNRDVKKIRERRTCFLLRAHNGSLLLFGARKLCAGLLVPQISLSFAKRAGRKGVHTVFPFFCASRQYTGQTHAACEQTHRPSHFR